MFSRIWRTLKWGMITMVLIAIAIPLWEKVVDSYRDFTNLAAAKWYLNWAPGWLALLLAIFAAGIITNIVWWFLIYWRFRNAAEIKIFDNPGDRSSNFELALIVGEWIDEDGEFYACDKFLDFIPPKLDADYLRKDREGIDFVRTGRDPREHIWDVFKCRIGIVRVPPKPKKN